MVTVVSQFELVEEAKEHPEGADRIALIESILELADPGDRPWEREQFEQPCSTRQEILPPVEALERARSRWVRST